MKGMNALIQDALVVDANSALRLLRHAMPYDEVVVWYFSTDERRNTFETTICSPARYQILGRACLTTSQLCSRLIAHLKL